MSVRSGRLLFWLFLIVVVLTGVSVSFESPPHYYTLCTLRTCDSPGSLETEDF